MSGSTSRAWAEAWRDPWFRGEALASAAGLLATLHGAAVFLAWIEPRPGAALRDPVLPLFTPHDLTWLTFSLIYAAIFLSITRLAREPRLLLVAVQAYVVMMAMRCAAIYLTPLDPPPGMIAMQDPFVERLGTRMLVTRDLFFSGHTSTLFLVFVAVPGRRYKALLLACTAAVAACLLWQRVHYSIDVLAAPVFAYASFRLVRWLHRSPAWLVALEK